MLPKEQAAANEDRQSCPCDRRGCLSAPQRERGSDGLSHVNLSSLKLAGLQLLAPAHGLHRSSAANECYRTSQKYARQTTGLKIRENTFRLLAKVGEDSAFLSIALLVR